MKRVILLIAILAGFVACEEKKKPMIGHIDDMMVIIKYPDNLSDITEPIVLEPLTAANFDANTSLELYVSRNAFVAKDYPKQDVTLAVDEKESTAVYGEDFDLSATEFRFRGADNINLPLKMDIGDAAGKKIVLRLVYDEYPSCPVEGRKADRIEISVNE